jgi:hypothetical protein
MSTPPSQNQRIALPVSHNATAGIPSRMLIESIPPSGGPLTALHLSTLTIDYSFPGNNAFDGGRSTHSKDPEPSGGTLYQPSSNSKKKLKI